MADLVVLAVSSLGVVSVGLLMLLENVFPPIPSELIMPLAGYLSSQDRLSFAGSIIAGTVGSAAGACFWYWLGRRWGREGLRSWAGKHGHWVGLTPEDVDRSHGWFQRHGYVAVFLGRLVPGVRSFISLPAGVGRMPVAPFLGLTVLGSALWSGALAWAGRVVGRNFQQVDRYLGPVSWVVIGVLLGLYLRRVWQRRRG
jgi:membrane protein DedA with SNARE-associated domain